MGGRVEGGGGAKGGRGNFLFEGGERGGKNLLRRCCKPGILLPRLGVKAFSRVEFLGGLVAATELVHFQGRPKGGKRPLLCKPGTCLLACLLRKVSLISTRGVKLRRISPHPFPRGATFFKKGMKRERNV